MAKEKKDEKGLTPRQRSFAQKYVETGNATQSYIDSGYKTRGQSATVNASNLLTNPNVKSYIDALIAQKDSAQIAQADEVLKFLTSVVRGEPTEEVISFWDGEEQRADKAPSIKDRVKAAELLGKRYLLFSEKHVHDHSHSIVFVDDLDDLENPVDEMEDLE